MSAEAKSNSSGAWQDRFTRPSVEALLGDLGEDERPLIETLRNALLARDGVSEDLVHMGVPWRWCLQYSMEADERFAFLVPQPGQPLFSLPLPEPLIDHLPLRKLSKGVRDGLVHARLVGRVVWAEWLLTSKTQGEELMQLASSKHEAIASGS